ncbi:hypothetical protein GCK72_018956 [Caenorhabditis remanei]|uniref:Seven TM Receptor n=1 Tax=Caenorhabditis remanei TaxID=31234 RepID=A0A6A5GCF3_CAERE|nr:hypothetical protein GCK72_018956 [Caenorhabditis remanei]KAF1752401.1 hypothetical protein GCK72_018956 [Caenorhabditis remanei]
MSTDHSLVSNIVARLGFCSTMIFGTIQILLTYFVSRHVFGSYKILITLFAAFGMTFAVVEVVVYPNVHMLNTGALYFTLSRPFNANLDVSKVLLAVYTWFYAFTISLLAVLFIYRYLAVFNQQYLRFFRGFSIIIWLSYCSFFGFQYSVGTYCFMYFDDVSFAYFKDEVPLRYNMTLAEIPAMGIVVYDPTTGAIRWWNVMCLLNIFTIMTIQYTIMICCGLKMHSEMEEKIKYYSASLRRHHQQFFKTLVIQISAPTMTLFAPLVFIICLPMFNMDIDMSVGVLICSFTMYPAIDALIVMYVVSDYRKVAIKLCKSIYKRVRTTFWGSKTAERSEAKSAKRADPASTSTQIAN